MTVTCRLVSHALAAVEPDSGLPGVLERHMAGCLRCQAMRVRDRRMRRGLQGLGRQLVAAPGWLATAVDRALVREGAATPLTVATPTAVSAHRRAPAGAIAGVAAAVAAGGAALVAWKVARRVA